MKTLVIAEKPSVGKDIGRVLMCRRSGNGYVEGDKYIVTWALGHLVTLADPEKYNSRYKTWNMDDLPIIPEKLELVIIKETSKQYNTVKELLYRKDVNDIVIATDAGREGELVARWILEKANCHKPLKRLWISSVTDNAIKEGFRKLKDGKEYQNLANSAKARAEADWLVGINATRCLTTKFNSQLSCGRVQTPTVNIISMREDEIKNFVPQKFYGLSAQSEGFDLTWQEEKTNNVRTFNEDKIKGIFSEINNKKEGAISEVTKTPKKMYSPHLYDLTELQRDASNRFGFSPKETLSIMQQLYERHKALTYPRTDSRYISNDIVPTIPIRLKACMNPQYSKICMGIMQKGVKANSNFVDDKKVSDHHAIIPTEQAINIRDLNDKERKIYDMVVIRFLSVLLPPFEYEQTTVKAKIGQETFVAKGKIVISKGFKEIYNSPEKDTEAETEEQLKDQLLPNIKKGDKIKISSLKITDGKTKPPAPFNDATLLSAMENPSKYMSTKNSELAKTLGETGGLGTVATRADIIEKLFDSFLLEKKGKDIFTTSKGRQLLKLAPTGLKSPELTGDWEQKLSKIAKGSLNRDSFIKEIRGYTKEIILEIKQSQEVFRHDNITRSKCPDCGKFMLEVSGKKGKMLICQDRECGHRENLSLITKARCPVCHKNLEMVGEGPKKRVTCSCGHTESYEHFQKRMEARSNQPTKKDVQNLLNQINTTEKQSGNKAFDALKGLKF